MRVHSFGRSHEHAPQRSVTLRGLGARWAHGRFREPARQPVLAFLAARRLATDCDLPAYVEDIVDGLTASLHRVHVLEGPEYEIINHGGPATTQLKELINGVGRTLSIEPRVRMQPRDVKRIDADITNAQKMVGYRTDPYIEGGLQKFDQWVENYYARRPVQVGKLLGRRMVLPC